MTYQLRQINDISTGLITRMPSVRDNCRKLELVDGRHACWQLLYILVWSLFGLFSVWEVPIPSTRMFHACGSLSTNRQVCSPHTSCRQRLLGFISTRSALWNMQLDERTATALYLARYMLSPVRLSVRHGRTVTVTDRQTNQSKTVEVKISNFHHIR